MFTSVIFGLQAMERIGAAEGGGLMRFWSWSLTLAVAALFLLIPLTVVMLPEARDALRQTRFLPNDGLWSPGPLHTAHQSIGANCNACHRRPFERVRDQVAQLEARGIDVDYRPGSGVRIGPHFCHREDECDRVVAAIVEARG